MSLWSSITKALHIDPPAGEIPSPLDAPDAGRHRIKIPLDPALISAGSIPEPTDHLFISQEDLERFSKHMPESPADAMERKLSASLLAKGYPEACAFGSPEAMNEMALWMLARPLSDKVFHGKSFTATIAPDSSPYYPSADIAFDNGEKIHVECTPCKNGLSVGFLQNDERSFYARLAFNYEPGARHQIEFHRRDKSGFAWTPHKGFFDVPNPNDALPAAPSFAAPAYAPEPSLDTRDEHRNDNRNDSKPTGLFADEMLSKNDFFLTSSNPFD